MLVHLGGLDPAGQVQTALAVGSTSDVCLMTALPSRFLCFSLDTCRRLWCDASVECRCWPCLATAPSAQHIASPLLSGCCLHMTSDVPAVFLRASRPVVLVTQAPHHGSGSGRCLGMLSSSDSPKLRPCSHPLSVVSRSATAPQRLSSSPTWGPLWTASPLWAVTRSAAPAQSAVERMSAQG